MPEPKTKRTEASVDAFLDAIGNDHVCDDRRGIAAIMEKATKAPARRWGSSIVAFVTLYRTPRLDEHRHLLATLRTRSCGKGCVYIKRLCDVHLPTLTRLVKLSVADLRKEQPA